MQLQKHILVSLFLILHFSKNNNLVGAWVYDEYTQYAFDESGYGKLLADNFSYEYTYKIEGEKVIIGFTENIIRDCDYIFSYTKQNPRLWVKPELTAEHIDWIKSKSDGMRVLEFVAHCHFYIIF